MLDLKPSSHGILGKRGDDEDEGGRQNRQPKITFTVSLITGASMVRIAQPRTQIESNDKI